MQVTGLAAYVNVARDRSVVWANDLAAKAPVSGATAEFVDLGGSAATDQDGVAVLDTPAELVKGLGDPANDARYYLKVQSGAAVTVIPAAQNMIDRWYYQDVPSGHADDYWRYFYTDRPMYKPTDIIKFWGLLKGRTAGAAVDKATVTLYKEGYVDYYYQPVRILTQDIELTAAGTFSGELKFENLRPDYYTVELRLGGEVIAIKYLQLKDYVKPAYQLELTPDRTIAFAGETVNLTAKASFFEGTPVPGLKLKLDPTGETVVTDADGQAKFTYSRPYTESDSYWPDYVYLRLTPTEGELADISAEANLRFYGPRAYLRTQTDYPAKGQAKVSLKARMIDIAGMESGADLGEDWQGKQPAAGLKIGGEVKRISYVPRETGTQYDFINKRTYKTYSYDRKEEIAGTLSGVTDAAGEYSYQFSTQPHG